jgi:threonine dehydrogenase-like Zn-dependent dehydrogenase
VKAFTRAVLDLPGRGVLDAEELITHRLPLTDLDRALAALTDRREPMRMAVVNPDRARH